MIDKSPPAPVLESLVRDQNYSDLPETWRVPDIERFSPRKNLYGYQQTALQNAAKVLYSYYGQAHDWKAGEAPAVNSRRKSDLAGRYGGQHRHPDGEFSIPMYETKTARLYGKINPIFRILSEFITPDRDGVAYRHLLNRMCFWMATGSGKTLVMVKLIAYLRRLMDHGEIPPHRILVLAPSDYLLEQIRKTVDEFNSAGGIQIELAPLRQPEGPCQGVLGAKVTVHYHRSDNISDVQKMALTNYRTYENGGKWYVLLDEAHKGGKEGSKRQAYYALMAREGFLFNFSATFTDAEDITTTAAKYNLQDFVAGGYGKNIYLNESQFRAFQNRKEEISPVERKQIVLKSLITLAFVSQRGKKVRGESGYGRLYHRPLMLTLVHSVNTDINDRNDLWAFFQTLKEIASGDIDDALFRESKDALLKDWANGRMFFDASANAGGLTGIGGTSLSEMKITDLREEIFLSRRKSELQFILSKDEREIAFQMKNADRPFALIRIGKTSKWRKELLAGFAESKTLKEKSFFDELATEDSSITILMGSRSFFESWDSNRPNVVNFINIGRIDAKKFVIQSVGRGVRIEPLPNHRRRIKVLMDGPGLSEEKKKMLRKLGDSASPLETLFLFATNRQDVSNVMKGLESNRNGQFEKVEGLVQSERPQISGGTMPLFVPAYREVKNGEVRRPQFEMSRETYKRFQTYLEGTSNSLLVVRDGLAPGQIKNLRNLAGPDAKGVKIVEMKDYGNLIYLQERLGRHAEFTVKDADGVRDLDEKRDIVHFREVRAAFTRGEIKDFQEKIKNVARGGGLTLDEKKELAGKFSRGGISEEEYQSLMGGKSADSHRDLLQIRHIAQHYYVPLVIAEDKKVDFIQHIIKHPSEKQFVEKLLDWLAQEQPRWDAWMFSKIDESLDKIHIPYYDSNEYRNFYPDFVFWMCKGNEYKIVFVDPKTAEYTSGLRKADGYAKLFERNKGIRKFSHGSRWKVAVHLKFFSSPAGAPDQYRKFWTDDIAEVFAP